MDENKKDYLIKIGSYCRKFRKYELEMTLEEVANGDNIKTLSAFEHGRSSNMFHIMKYLYACKDNGYKMGFIQGLNDIMGGSEAWQEERWNMKEGEIIE